jgi:membrane-bound lytic murein transglycosylase B
MTNLAQSIFLIAVPLVGAGLARVLFKNLSIRFASAAADQPAEPEVVIAPATELELATQKIARAAAKDAFEGARVDIDVTVIPKGRPQTTLHTATVYPVTEAAIRDAVQLLDKQLPA